MSNTCNYSGCASKQLVTHTCNPYWNIYYEPSTATYLLPSTCHNSGVLERAQHSQESGARGGIFATPASVSGSSPVVAVGVPVWVSIHPRSLEHQGPRPLHGWRDRCALATMTVFLHRRRNMKTSRTDHLAHSRINYQVVLQAVWQWCFRLATYTVFPVVC